MVRMPSLSGYSYRTKALSCGAGRGDAREPRRRSAAIVPQAPEGIDFGLQSGEVDAFVDDHRVGDRPPGGARRLSGDGLSRRLGGPAGAGQNAFDLHRLAAIDD